jgi:hypothetical protein
MVRLTVSLTAPNRHARDLLAALHYIGTSTHFEKGCLGCSVWTGPEAALQYVEEWATEDDMRRRVRSERFTSVLSVIEAALEPPRVQFDFVARRRGLDYVAEIRDQDAS